MRRLKLALRFVFINFLVSLMVFQPSALAISAKQKDQFKNFLERTQISKKDVSYFDYQWSLRGIVPEATRQQLATWAYLNPFLRLPQVKFQFIKDGQGKDVIQFYINQDNQSATGTLSFLDNGDPIVKIGQTTIKMADLNNLNELFAKLNKEIKSDGGYFPKLHKKLVILSASDIDKLSEPEKRTYYKNYLKLLEASEKFQNDLLQNKKTSHNFIYDLLLEKAYANTKNAVPDANETCINAGHVGTYVQEGGRWKCKLSQTKCENTNCQNDQGQLQCNPLIYGKGVYVEKGKELYATKNCNDQVLKNDGSAARYYFDKIKNKKEFEEQNAKVEATLSGQLSTCTDIQNRPQGRILPDQFDTAEHSLYKGGYIDSPEERAQINTACANLSLQVDEIKKVTCQQVESLATKQGRTELGQICSEVKIADQPVQVPTNKTISDCLLQPIENKQIKADEVKMQPAPEIHVAKANKQAAQNTIVKSEDAKICIPPPKTDPPQPPVDVVKDCTGSAYSVSEMTCRNGTLKKVYCGVNNNLVYNCDCGKGSYAVQNPVTGDRYCEPTKTQPVSMASTSSKDSIWDKKKMQPWISAGMKFGIGALILGMMYYFAKKQIKAQADFLMPSPTATPVPAPAPTPRPRSGTR